MGGEVIELEGVVYSYLHIPIENIVPIFGNLPPLGILKIKMKHFAKHSLFLMNKNCQNFPIFFPKEIKIYQLLDECK